MASTPAPGSDADKAAQRARYLDADGRFPCPRCDAALPPKSLHVQTFRLDRATSYDTVVVVCAACSRDSVFVRRWGFQSFHAVADTGDFIENYHDTPTVETTTAWIRRVSTPHGRRLLPFPNVDDRFLRPYRAACQTFDASPEASAAHARQCLHMVLGAQGYGQDCLAARIDAAFKDQNPKKRLPTQVRSSLDALRRYETFGSPDTDLTVPAALRDVATGEAEATIAAAEALMDYCYEAPKRMEDELEALRRALADGKN
ncbi:MAG: hypothetical protein RLZ98_847 [Pseudomonadota bacterium]|jgi:hypothetical protein